MTQFRIHKLSNTQVDIYKLDETGKVPLTASGDYAYSALFAMAEWRNSHNTGGHWRVTYNFSDPETRVFNKRVMNLTKWLEGIK